MKTSSKRRYAVLAVVASLGIGGVLTSAHADPPVLLPKPQVAVAATQTNCAGESGFDVGVERARDIRVSMSRPLGASGWNTMLTATGRVTTIDHGGRLCGSAANVPTNTVQITAEEPDARAALQTCAVMGASLGAGQRMSLTIRALEGARVGPAGRGIMLTKLQQLDCGVVE